MSSQNTLEETRVIRTVIINNDTLIQIPLSDAKIILQGVLENEIADSLLTVFMNKDSINTDIIELQISQIKLLQEKSKNQEQLNQNLNLIIQNKDLEINELNALITEQKKQLKKERFLKKLSMVGNVVLPIVTLFIVLGG
jgi:hypothetical protein